MVSPTQVCWRYHSLPLSQRCATYHKHWEWRSFGACSRGGFSCEGVDVLRDCYLRASLIGTRFLCRTFLNEMKCNRYEYHDDVIKWKHFPRYWPFVRGIHWSPVNSLHKEPVTRSFMLYLICAWIKGWVNNREAGDLRRHRAHYDVTVMCFWKFPLPADNMIITMKWNIIMNNIINVMIWFIKMIIKSKLKYWCKICCVFYHSTKTAYCTAYS